jgi:hypothetical protein
MNIKQKILDVSSFNLEKDGNKYVASIECVGFKYSVTFSTNIQYYGSIDKQLKNILVNGLIESNGFIKKFEQIETRNKNLNTLLPYVAD